MSRLGKKVDPTAGWRCYGAAPFVAAELTGDDGRLEKLLRASIERKEYGIWHCLRRRSDRRTICGRPIRKVAFRASAITEWTTCKICLKKLGVL